MSDRHAFADTAAILFEQAEPRQRSLVAKYGVSHQSELRPEFLGDVFRRPVFDTAAADFPTANLETLENGSQSFDHPAFLPAWGRIKSSIKGRADPFAMARGVDAAVVLAGFGLPVAPFDFGQGILEKPSDDIDTVLVHFTRWKTAFVGYDVCSVPFYVLLTDCSQTLQDQLSIQPDLSDVRRLFARTSGSLPSVTGERFKPGMGLFERWPGDVISSVQLMSPNPEIGSIMLYAGWKVKGQPYGVPYAGYLPFPLPLLCAVVYHPEITPSLLRLFHAPTSLH